MNMLLLFLLIAAGEAAYFETMVQQQTADGFQQQENDWQKEDDSLRAENKQLGTVKADLLRDIASTEAEINDLNGQLHGQPAAAANAPAPAASGTAAPTPTPASADQTADDTATTVLGTITTTDNQKYEDCHLLKVEPDGITFSHSQGINKVLFTNLPADLQARFEVDSTTGTASPAAQTRYENLIRQKAASGGAGQ